MYFAQAAETVVCDESFDEWLELPKGCDSQVGGVKIEQLSCVTVPRCPQNACKAQISNNVTTWDIPIVKLGWDPG